MTAKKKWKRKIRARMEQTGESYMAMHALQAGKPEPVRMSDAEVVAEYGQHLGVDISIDRNRPAGPSPVVTDRVRSVDEGQR